MPEDVNAKLQAGINPSNTTAEEVQSYIAIATALLRDLLLARGWSEEQWNEYRKQITASEIEFIDAEIAKFGGDTDPLPV